MKFNVKVKDAVLVMYHSMKCMGEWTSQGNTVVTQALEVSNHLDATVHLCGKDLGAVRAGE